MQAEGSFRCEQLSEPQLVRQIASSQIQGAGFLKIILSSLFIEVTLFVYVIFFITLSALALSHSVLEILFA